MRKPKAGAVYTRDAWWARMDAHKARVGALPPFAFDFIGVHPSKSGEYTGYSMSSPMCLVDPNTGARPPWEETRYKTKAAAVEAARTVGREHGLPVVDCREGGAS